MPTNSLDVAPPNAAATCRSPDFEPRPPGAEIIDAALLSAHCRESEGDLHLLISQRLAAAWRENYAAYLDPDGGDTPEDFDFAQWRVAEEASIALGLDPSKDEARNIMDDAIEHFNSCISVAPDGTPADLDGFRVAQSATETRPASSRRTTALLVPLTFATRSRGRSRAPRRGTCRRHGSRRSSTRSASRGDPDDGESEPARGWLPDRVTSDALALGEA